MTPIVSVIIPCHDALGTIEEAVQSVLAQTYGALEVILVPDDARDYRAFLAGRGIADARLRQVAPPPKRTGHLRARDRGTAVARGSILADLDADDRWAPGRLEALVPLAEHHGAAQDVMAFFDASGTFGHSGPLDGGVTELAPADIPHIVAPFHLVRRADVPMEPWHAFPLYGADMLRAALYAARAGLAWLGEPLMGYRIELGSMSQSAEGDRRCIAGYREIRERLAAGDWADVSDGDRADLIEAFRWRIELNEAHLRHLEEEGAEARFIAWHALAPGARPWHKLGSLPERGERATVPIPAHPVPSPTPGDGDDARRASRIERRHLQDTVRALRARLDEAAAAHDADLDDARSAARRDADELRSTVAALRERLEAQAAAHDEALRAERAEAVRAQAALQRTAAALRAELERMRVDDELARQRAADRASGEAAELRETVTALRHELATQQAAHDEARDDAARRARREADALRETARRLRAELEAVEQAWRERLNAAERAARRERETLQATVVAMRERLAEAGEEAP